MVQDTFLFQSCHTQMKHNPLSPAATVFSVAHATTSGFLACQLTGLLEGTAAAKKPLEQCLEGSGSPCYDPVEWKDQKSPVSAICTPKSQYTLDQ